jgi:hypothetical protein
MRTMMGRFLEASGFLGSSISWGIHEYTTSGGIGKYYAFTQLSTV